MQSKVRDDSAGGCEGCGDRRDFLGDAAALLASALVGLGLSTARAHAFELGVASPLRLAGRELVLAMPAADGAIVYPEHSLILARHAGAVYAFSLACPHQRAALRWMAPKGIFQCPKHKSRYRPDGVYISGRATRSMDRFAVRRQDRNVVVDLARRLREDQDREEWTAAVVRIG